MNNWKKYIDIARPSHWVKHIFILPGIILAFLLIRRPDMSFIPALISGLISACFLASANYVLNEWIDARFDRFHPLKKHRPAAAGEIKAAVVIPEYLIFVSSGLYFAARVNIGYLWAGAFFVTVALLYNVPPLRLKDCVFLDVITESINNPIRLAFGWLMVDSTTIPPLSLMILYWFGGAFLMTTKRLAEYRYMKTGNRLADLQSYRSSFKKYTENNLLLSVFLYGLLSSFMIATFLIKYRNEYLFVYPVFALLFTYYLALGLRPISAAQSPEKLYKDRGLVIIIVLLATVLFICTYKDIPIASRIVGIDQKAINYKFWE